MFIAQGSQLIQMKISPPTETGEESPVTSFVQLERYNAIRLVQIVHASLSSLSKVIRGTALLDAEVQALAGALLKQEVSDVMWCDEVTRVSVECEYNAKSLPVFSSSEEERSWKQVSKRPLRWLTHCSLLEKLDLFLSFAWPGPSRLEQSPGGPWGSYSLVKGPSC